MANYIVEADDKGARIIREDGVYSWFTANESKCNYKNNSFNFVRKLQENASFYIGLIENKFHNNSNLYLENISYMVGQASKQHYILLLSAINLAPLQFNLFVRGLENLLFYYMITNEPARDLEKRFADWAQEIQKIKTDEDLKDFIRSRFLVEVQRKETAFKENFTSVRFSNIQKFKLKYVLAKIDHYLEKERINGEDYSLAEYFKRNIHIEHILPEEYDDIALQQHFGNDKKEYDKYKERIGNLTLLEEPINTSIKNKPYSLKKEEYRKSKFYLTKSITQIENVGKDTAINRINEMLKSFAKWNKRSIDERQDLLLRLTTTIWSIDKLL